MNRTSSAEQLRDEGARDSRPRTSDFGGNARFEVRSRLGEGAMGVVYEAFDRDHATRVAVKTMRPLGADALLLFKNEFRAMQHVKHRNLISLGELFEDHDRWFFSMEFVTGVPLLEFLRGGAEPGASAPRVDLERLRSCLVQIANGLSVLHRAGLVHRDLKPTNVLVQADGRLVILDFGLVRDVRRALDPADDALVGTAAYMAPEQALGETIGPAADWYAVGVMLFQALVGRTPLEGSAIDILSAKPVHVPPAPSTLADGVPEDLDALCVALLQLEPGARPSAGQVLQRLGAVVRPSLAPGAPAPASGKVFVGRSRELEVIEEAFAEVRKGRAVSVLIDGVSGVGKSELLRRFTDGLRERDKDAVVLFGRCFERESVQYKAIDEVVDDLSRFISRQRAKVAAELVPPHPRLLCNVFPVLTNVEAFAARRDSAYEELVPQEKRVRVFAALRELLQRIALRWPLVVCIDDLQWTDPDSRALLEAVLRPPGAPGFLLIGTLRVASEHGEGSPELPWPGEVRRIHLAKLSTADAEQLVVSLFGSTSAGEGEIGAIAREADGHPLFIDELFRQRARAVKGAKVLRLDDALWSRVGELAGAERRVIELLSVASLPISYDAVATAASMEVGELFEVVAKLRAVRLARTDGAQRGDVVATYHDRVRESVLAHLPPEARAGWHERLAVALEASGSAGPESLSIHWHGAGRPDLAARYAEQAADDAARALAFDRAARLYRTALALAPAQGVDPNPLKLRLAAALANGGRGAEAAAVRLDVAQTSEPLQAIDLRRVAAEEYLCSGHFDEGQATLKAVVAQMGVRYPKSPLSAVLLIVVYRLLLRLRGHRARKAAAATPLELLKMDCTWSAGAGLLMTDNVRGVYFQTYALLQTARLGDPERLCRALCMEALAGGGPDRPRSRMLIGRAQEIADRLGSSTSRAFLALAEGATAYFWGEWRRAVLRLGEAEELFRDRCVGATYELDTVRMMLCRTLGYMGDAAALRERVPPILEDAERREDRYALINMRTLVMADLAADETGRVAQDLALADEQLPKGKFVLQHYLAYWGHAQLELYEGHGAEAYRQVIDGLPAIKKAMLLRVPILRIGVLDLRARVAIAAAIGNPAERPALLALASKDARAVSREGYAWADALARLLQGAIARVRGQPDEAVPCLRRAVASFDEQDMALHAAAARRALGGLVGGEEGSRLVATGTAAMVVAGVQRPECITRMLLPGGEPAPKR